MEMKLSNRVQKTVQSQAVAEMKLPIVMLQESAGLLHGLVTVSVMEQSNNMVLTFVAMIMMVVIVQKQNVRDQAVAL